MLASQMAWAQIGGLRSFEFVEIPSNAKVSGLGTVNISAGSNDLNMVNQNPALLDSTMDNNFSLTIAPYFADIFNTQMNYAKSFKKLGILHLGVFYQSFGSFDGYDNTGQTTNPFNAGNYLISVSHSRKQGIFNYGASLKFAGTQYASYQSSAVLLDIGGIFKHPSVDFTAGLVIKNLGFYTARDAVEDRNLPFDIQLGGTFKPAFMPFRFSLTVNRLYRYDLSYFEPISTNDNNPFVDVGLNKPTTFDKLFQHLTIGTELILGKSLTFSAGYNHLIRQSLRRTDIAGAGGFTFGINFRTKRINLGYAHAIYQVGGAAHFITLGTNFNTLIKRKSS